MSFTETDWNQLLPRYLSDPDKGRLKAALKQFKPEHRGKDISYDQFYSNYGFDYFLQGDVLGEIRLSVWNKKERAYSKGYVDAIIISNSCDISFENERKTNIKECLFAPIISL